MAMGVPTYYVRLLNRLNTSILCGYVLGSAPLLREAFDEFKERTGHTILERYGMTGDVYFQPLPAAETVVSWHGNPIVDDSRPRSNR